MLTISRLQRACYLISALTHARTHTHIHTRTHIGVSSCVCCYYSVVCLYFSTSCILFILLFIYLSTYPSTNTSIYLFIYLYIYLLTYLSTYLSTNTSIYLPIYLSPYPFIYYHIYLSIYLSYLRLSTHLLTIYTAHLFNPFSYTPTCSTSTFHYTLPVNYPLTSRYLSVSLRITGYHCVSLRITVSGLVHRKDYRAAVSYFVHAESNLIVITRVKLVN